MLAARSFTKPKLSKQGKDKVVKQDCHTTLSYKKIRRYDLQRFNFDALSVDFCELEDSPYETKLTSNLK